MSISAKDSCVHEPFAIIQKRQGSTAQERRRYPISLFSNFIVNETVHGQRIISISTIFGHLFDYR